MSSRSNDTVIALDIGAARIGVAKAFVQTKLPQPYDTLRVDETILDRISTLSQDIFARAIVVGLPRNLDGNDSQQTRDIRDFYEKLSNVVSVPLYFQDEAGTSKQAEQELASYKKRSNTIPDYISVDSIAATYILEDFIREGVHHDIFN